MSHRPKSRLSQGARAVRGSKPTQDKKKGPFGPFSVSAVTQDQYMQTARAWKDEAPVRWSKAMVQPLLLG